MGSVAIGDDLGWPEQSLLVKLFHVFSTAHMCSPYTAHALEHEKYWPEKPDLAWSCLKIDLECYSALTRVQPRL